MKSKKKVFSLKGILTLMVALCLTLSSNAVVYADVDTSPAVAEARQGVLQINLVYIDPQGNQHILETGSGFLVGASTGATTVITNHHVVTLDDEQKAACSEAFGVDFFDSNSINLQMQVVVKRDVVIPANYLNGSEKTDFAILELSQAIHDRSPLKIADADSTVETQSVYALGFPWVTSAVADDQVYTSDDVTVTSGIIGKFQTIDNIKYILHDADLGYGNSGGPLVDSNGNVVGVNTMYSGDGAGNYYYSVSINEVADVMDALGIVYETADGNAATEPETEQDTEPMTETEAEPTPIPDPISDPIPEPETEAESDSNMTLIVIVAAAAAVVVIAVVVVVVVSSKKKKKKVPPMAGPMGQTPGGYPGQSPQPSAPKPPMSAPQQPIPPMPPYGSGTMPVDSGAGETSVLGGGAGETSVLGGGSMQPSATIIRRKNGESATIVKPNYTIGKERAKVDFCIPDNNSISRTHARIVCRGGVYYLVDNNSTNYTFVNGNKITAGQEVKLNSGDKIKFADEEFDFRL